MKTVLIVLGVLVLVAVLVVGGFALFMINDLKATEQLAIGPVNPAGLADGAYEGSYGGGRFANRLTVTVQDGKIASIQVTKPVLFERTDLTDRLIGSVVERQSTDVDVETGATATSNAYLKSIENALSEK